MKFRMLFCSAGLHLTSATRIIVLVVIAMFTLVPTTSKAQVEDTPTDPNILFVLTDDLDLHTDDHMRQLQRRVADQGVTFSNAFVTDPVCCPSRASFLTGKYVHNHTVYSNRLNLGDGKNGGAPQFRRSGEDGQTMATMMKKQGYRTIFIGKYMSYYNTPAYVPPSWDRWIGQMGLNNNYSYSVDGERTIKYDPKKYYETKILGGMAVNQIRVSRDKPFFMYLSLNSPHVPERGLPKHQKLYRNARVPTPPNYNERDVSDKPPWIKNSSRLSAEQIRRNRDIHRNRLRSMKAVDEMLQKLLNELNRTDELDNTYIVFTSDNGFHLGNHRLWKGKGTPYEEDVRVPLYIRGPGIEAGETLDHIALNIDLASTFAEMAGGEAPDDVDGRSLIPLFEDNVPTLEEWRESFLIDIYAGRPFFSLRTNQYSYTEYESGHRELYDIENDPYQLESLHDAPEQAERIREFSERLEKLKSCSGQEECKAAERTAPK